MKKKWFLIIIAFALLGCSEDAEPTEISPALLPELELSGTEAVPLSVAPADEAAPSPSFTATLEVEQPTETVASPTQPPEPTPEPTTATPVPSPTPAPAFDGEPLSKEKGELFSGSGTCRLCHTNLTDESGVDVSIDSYWRSTMMANAARDPYWQASVQAEMLELPEYQSIIEDTCATCHLPMGRTTLAAAGEEAQIFSEGMLNEDHPLHELGMDGVSCTLCHQVEGDNLGEVDSFSGGYLVDTELPAGERVNYGPFPVGEEDAEMMQEASGFIPVQSEHVQQSELCAACHTLYTPTIDEAGEIAGQFPEQMPYFEWLHSDYLEIQSCQDCHMPAAGGAVVISAVSDTPRSPFHQHAFVGGNGYMLRVLRNNGEEMGVTASSEQIEATILRVVSQLQENTAQVELLEGWVNDGRLELQLSVSSDVGHKFPSGFPSRRAWLHVTVTDASGSIVFESGDWSPDGAIIGNDNDENPALFEPHYEMITDPYQVQIYETQLINTEGIVTTALLRGAGYIKDNRLLPKGFDKSTAPEFVAVRGLASEDTDFDGGGDLIRFEIEVGEANGPFSVSVELLYQSIGYRWAENLKEAGQENSAPAVGVFLEAYATVPNEPVLISATSRKFGS